MSPNITPSWVLALAPEIGLLVVLAVAFNEIRRGSSAGRKRMFPGAIGWVIVLTLAVAITLEVFAADTQHRFGASLLVGGVALVALLGRKIYEDYA